jgi:hypothetical protein
LDISRCANSALVIFFFSNLLYRKSTDIISQHRTQ